MGHTCLTDLGDLTVPPSVVECSAEPSFRESRPAATNAKAFICAWPVGVSI
jgi:hypothetical protein